MQLFVTDGSGHHEARVLEGALAIGIGPELIPIDASAISKAGQEIARLIPWQSADGRRGALLLARSCAVIVNGRAALPATVLRRGSEIRAGGMSCFFTDESPLRVVSFTPDKGANDAICTRCQGQIQAGDPVIYCPLCGVAYMAQPDKSPNCWDFGPCLVCGRDPQVAFVWEPDASDTTVRRPQ